MAATTEKEYVLGTHDEELMRLGFQHRVWGEYAFALWERAGFRPGQTLLDIGCGPGFATLDLASIVGASGRVMAVDASPRYIDHLKGRAAALGQANVVASVADVQRLDLPPGSIDGAYARWVFCFLSDPAAVVNTVARALRPGGVLAVQDYHNYLGITLGPRSAIFDRVVAATDKSWRLRGGDPDIVGKLPALLAAAGLHVREIRPIARVGRPGSLLWQWPTTFFRIFIPTLIEMGLLTTEDQRAFDAEWNARSNDSNTFFVTPPVYDVIAIKP